MTKKDYKLIAGALHTEYVQFGQALLADHLDDEALKVWAQSQRTGQEVILAVAHTIGVSLKADNPLYKHERFIDAVVDGKGL